MGCDIHLFTEIKQADGTWKPLSDLVPNEYYDPEEAWSREFELPEEFNERNYSLFSILAGVRNGVGFGGVDPVVPIFDPRGVPADASEEYAAEVDLWDSDGHSHSWLTLAEVYEHDWESKITHRCMIRYRNRGTDKYPAKALNDDEFATEVQTMLNRYGSVVFDWPAWGIDACGYSSEGEAGGWRRVEWTSTHRDSAGGAWAWFLVETARQAHSRGLTPSDIRFVFFFDN